MPAAMSPKVVTSEVLLVLHCNGDDVTPVFGATKREGRASPCFLHFESLIQRLINFVSVKRVT